MVYTIPTPQKHISHLFQSEKHKKNNVKYQTFFSSEVHKLGKPKSFNNNDKTNLSRWFAFKR